MILLSRPKELLAGLGISLTLLLATPTHAATCTAGQEGSIHYSANVLEYCDGANWKSMGYTTLTACTSPGKTQYSAGEIQYCNGTNWISMDSGTVESCSGTTAGSQRYNTTENQMEFCNGTDWMSSVNADGGTGCSGAPTSGNDTITCKAGNDSVNGGDGDDTIYGGNGDDTLFGNKGADSLYGEGGDDTFVYTVSTVGLPSDTDVQGGPGYDTLVCESSGQTDSITLPNTFSLANNSIEAITCQAADADKISNKDDGYNNWDFTGITITGVSRIDANPGDDVVVGSAGDDVIEGDEGADSLYGGDGNDTFLYRISTQVGGDTVLDGGNGTDKVHLDYTGGVSENVNSWLWGNNIEVLDLTNTDSSDTVTLDSSQIGSGATFTIDGDAGDSITDTNSATRGANSGGYAIWVDDTNSNTLKILLGLKYNGVTMN